MDINEKEGSAILDFEGTGPEVRNNLNTPTPVVHSAIIYCMRAMLDVDIPLNAGCLVPLESELLPLPLSSNTILILSSQNPQKVIAFTFSDSSSLCRKCPDITAHRRCGAESI